MAVFRKVNKAAISPMPSKAAAAGGVNWYSGNQAGKGMIGQYYSYIEGDLRNRFMQVPTVSRARDLHASILSTLELKMYRRQWNGEEMEEIYLEPRSWLSQLDPEMPNSYLWSWILDDLLFFGRAFLYITARTTDGYMAQATRLPAGSVTTEDMAGPVWFGKSKEIYFQGGELDYQNVVQLVSPLQGIIYSAFTPLETALQIEAARSRNASSAIPAGVLKQTGGEPFKNLTTQQIQSYLGYLEQFFYFVDNSKLYKPLELLTFFAKNRTHFIYPFTSIINCIYYFIFLAYTSRFVTNINKLNYNVQTCLSR